MKKLTLILGVLLMLAGVCALSGGSITDRTYGFETPINALWQYNSSSNVYYVVGLVYCASPANQTYEQMGIFVPGAFMDATNNGNGTFTCTINSNNTINGFTASTAPIVIQVNTPGYSAQSAPTGYSSSVATYTNAGFVYLWAGCRGKTQGAPLGVTDLKAAVRYFRYLQAEQNAVPGNADRMFSFGMSGGGAQSSILGASGNSAIYADYLAAIGAESDYGDNIYGSMCWCPVTNLDQGDASYEWNMGLTRSSLSTADQNISKGLAAEFAAYVNACGFQNPSSGETLSLTSTADGYYQNGSYYGYIIDVINDAITRYNSYHGTSVPLYSTTDINALHTFASSYKNATKGIGAFDDYDAMGTPENTLFGISGSAGHFDRFLAELINTYAPSYYPSFTEDLASTNVDAVGKTVDERLMAYTPLYYLIDNSTYYNGGGSSSSDVAPCWRIRTGIQQGDTSLNTEINLALALMQQSEVLSVDFETIWGLGHTQAEDTGNATTNFITWVEEMAAVVGIPQGSEAVPSSLGLFQNYPNPFKSETTLVFSLRANEHVDVEVFNIRGQRVATLINESCRAGKHTAVWNGTDDAGKSLEPGIYLARIQTAGSTQTRRIILLK
jgi:hypothetical protein